MVASFLGQSVQPFFSFADFRLVMEMTAKVHCCFLLMMLLRREQFIESYPLFD
jgi:hypothetical protein